VEHLALGLVIVGLDLNTGKGGGLQGRGEGYREGERVTGKGGGLQRGHSELHDHHQERSFIRISGISTPKEREREGNTAAN
jgi:hypothetical protein